MASLCKAVGSPRITASLCYSTYLRLHYHGYRNISGSTTFTSAEKVEKNEQDGKQSKLKHTDDFSEGPDLSDFIAGVVPRQDKNALQNLVVFVAKNYPVLRFVKQSTDFHYVLLNRDETWKTYEGKLKLDVGEKGRLRLPPWLKTKIPIGKFPINKTITSGGAKHRA